MVYRFRDLRKIGHAQELLPNRSKSFRSVLPRASIDSTSRVTVMKCNVRNIVTTNERRSVFRSLVDRGNLSFWWVAFGLCLHGNR